MKFFGRRTLAVAALCLGGLAAPTGAQQAQTPPAQQPPPQQNPPQPAPQQRNPFEDVPGTAPKPAQPPAQPSPPEPVPSAPSQPAPQLEAPKPAPVAPQAATGDVIKEIQFRGARRVPSETLKALIFTKTGDLFSEEALRRDFMALWNTGRFDDIVLETEPDPAGGLILRFVVTERRVIRTINYEGIHTVTVSEILDRFKERKVGLVVESQYDPNKIQHAAQVLKEFLSERGRQYATVDPVVEQIPPSSLKVTFNVKEGPKVKVGKIIITGNQAEPQRWVVMGGRGDERRPLLTTAQVSKWLGVATRTVCLWAESQEIPAFKIGRQWRFHDAAIRCWFETQEAKEKLLFPEGADLRRQAKAE